MTHLWVRATRLGTVESGRANNLNLVRFLLAACVILSHSCDLLGRSQQDPAHVLLHFSNLGEIGVFGFFFISGYLIFKSAMRRDTPAQYLRARGLRIFPGMIVSVLLCLVVVGPLVTTLPLRAYFHSPVIRAYLPVLWLHHNDSYLPGVFQHNLYTLVNGSLWTLPAEWTMYVLTLLVCLGYRQFRGTSRLTGLSWLLVAGCILFTAQMMPLRWAYAAPWMAFFCLGSACYMLRDRILLSLPAALALLAAEVLLLRVMPHAGKPLFPLVLCYCLLAFGYHPAIYFRPFTRLGDYSYGLYIYGWPVQQLLVNKARTPLALFAESFAITLLLAVLSWSLVEQPCLRLKRGRMPGTGARAAILQVPGDPLPSPL